MKKIFFIFATVSLLYSGERKVLVEMFTNSHCGLCPAAHAALNSYASTSPNANRMRYIYYHTLFPYSDDPLAQANNTEPATRNSYYNGATSTPNTFFDGVNQGRTYSSFAANLDAQMAVESPIDIQLSGNKNGTTITVNASLSKTGTISESDLVIHIVAVENVSYVGRNGVSPQNYVMRKMITGTSGESFQFDQSNAAQISKSAALTNITDINKIGVVVFVQSVSTKKYISRNIFRIQR